MSFAIKDFSPRTQRGGSSPGRGGRSLFYPVQDNAQYKSRISFQVMKVIPPRFNAQFEAKPVEGGGEGGGDIKEIDGDKSTTTGLSSVDVRAISGEKVDLYLPITFMQNDRAEYNSSALGMAGASVNAGLSSGATLSSSVLQGVQQAGQSFAALFQAFDGQEITGLGAARIAQAIPTQGLRDALTLTARVIINPNVRTVFNGVAVRDFAFQFQFQPKSPEESIAVRDIIKLFRYHLYPSEISGSFNDVDIPLAFDYPHMFKIKLLSGAGSGEPFKHVGAPIKLSYLRSVSASYNNQSSALHEDGSPTDINLTLGFIEYKTISKDDIMNEDNDTFYHHEYTNRDVNPPSGYGPDQGAR